MNIGLNITSLIPMIQCACQMTVLKTLSIICCSARNTLSTELCFLAKLPPFTHLMELIVTHLRMKNCYVFYCMEMMPLTNLQIRTFSPQQSYTSTLQIDFFSCRTIIFSYLFIFIFISSSVMCFIPIGIKERIHNL